MMQSSSSFQDAVSSEYPIGIAELVLSRLQPELTASGRHVGDRVETEARSEPAAVDRAVDVSSLEAGSGSWPHPGFRPTAGPDRDRDRCCLARDLHDGPIQELLAASYQLACLRQQIDDGVSTATLGEQVEALRRDLLDVVWDLRGVIRELRPSGLQEFGLRSAIEGYVAALQRKLPECAPRFVLDIAESFHDIPPSLAFALFRVGQEAIRNAVRHAGASGVSVALERRGTALLLTVRDDGRGFEVPKDLDAFAERGHFGLVGIAEQIELAGGTWRIVAAPGRGTAVMVRVPLGGTGDGGG
jgi:signal transduction histidine kinase